MQLKIPKSAMEGIRRFVSFVSTFFCTHIPIFRKEISHTNIPSVEGSTKSVEFNSQAEKSAKRKRENQYRGIRQRKGGKCVADIRVPGSGDRRWLGTFNAAEEAVKAFDAGARRFHGKKAKLNFPDEAPRASPKRSVQTNSQKSIPRASVVQNFSYTSKSEYDCFNTPLPPNGDTRIKSFTPSDNNPVYFNFDQGSNSFDCSDFGGVEQVAKTPVISSVLLCTPEIYDPLYLEDANPSKKLKSGTENVVSAEDNSGKSLSEDLFAFDNQMPYLEESCEASHDGFLNGEATQDGGNAMELWSFVSES